MVRPVPTWIPRPGAPIPVEYADQSRTADAGRAASVRKFTDRRERIEAQRAARERDRQAAADARRAELMRNPAVAALMGEAYANSDSGFVWDMRRKVQAGEELSPRMVEAIERMTTRDAQRQARDAARREEWQARDAAALAAGVRVPSGRVTFTGTVTGYKQDYNTAGRLVLKITVGHADGWRVFGTCPAAFQPQSYTAVTYRAWLDSLKGREITLTATLEPKAGDPLFGWFSRPTLADPAAVTPAPAAAAPAPDRGPARLRKRAGTASARPCPFHPADTVCPACGAPEPAADPAPAPADTFVSGWGDLL
jgi:hypothetical protein